MCIFLSFFPSHEIFTVTAKGVSATKARSHKDMQKSSLVREKDESDEQPARISGVGPAGEGWFRFT